jgi:hypothetical protein
MADGNVSRMQVVEVLTACASFFEYSIAVDGVTVILVKNGAPMSWTLPDEVPRKMIQRLHHRYGINIEYFYRPGMMQSGQIKPA